MAAMSDFLEREMRTAMFRSSPLVVRANSTAYSLGDIVYPASGFDGTFYECTTDGTSAGSPPTFNNGLGQTTTDGTVTWTALKFGLAKRPLYFGLFTTDPTDAGGGNEVSGGNYSRAQLDPSDSNWTAPDATGGLTDNAVAITFPTPSANWGTVTHMAIFDKATGGNPLYHGALTNSKTINNGDPAPSFPIGTLDVTHA